MPLPEVIPIHQRRPSLPQQPTEVIGQALKETPGLRFPTAAPFRDALKDVL